MNAAETGDAPLDLARIEAWAGRIAPLVKRTRLEPNATLSGELGVPTHLKLELFQTTGSFKPRGTFAQLLGRLEEARAHGVVAVSGGNFAQAVGYAASRLGVRARVLMARDTPANYVDATRGYGAEVELTEDIAEAFERALAYQQEGWVALHPFAHVDMMAGNGSLGLEIAEDLPDVTDVVVSIGGGGLVAGVATALAGRVPGMRVWGVETEGADVLTRSLAAGEPVAMRPTSRARTLGAPNTTAAVLDAVRRHVREVRVVSDAEAFEGVRWFLERAKLATELAAGCTLAAARALRAEGRIPSDARLVLVVCGGNVSLESLCDYRAALGA